MKPKSPPTSRLEETIAAGLLLLVLVLWAWGR